MQGPPPPHQIPKKFIPSLAVISNLVQTPTLRKHYIKYITTLQIPSIPVLPDPNFAQFGQVFPPPPGTPMIPMPMPTHNYKNFIRDAQGLQVHQIRALKKVKYITNLNHASHFDDPILNSVLSQRRIFVGKVKVTYPQVQKKFLKRTKAAKTLELLTIHDFIPKFSMNLRQAVRGFSRSTTLQFNLQDANAITSENLHQLLKSERRNANGFHLNGLEFSNIDFFDFQFVKLQTLCLKNISPLLLAVFLLKAAAFNNLEILQLNTLTINQDFPLEMIQNFALFPRLQNLLLEIQLTDPELSSQFLTKFTLGSSLKILHITLKDLRFPNPLDCKPNDYLPFQRFAEKLSFVSNVQDLKLHFGIIENFRGIDSIITHLPMNLNKVKKLDLEFLEQQQTNSTFEDTRIVMKDLFQWIFSMPSLEVFLLETIHRDYTGLSTLTIPESLTWKTFDILEWPEESQDTLKPDDFATFMEILTKAQHLRCLTLKRARENSKFLEF